MAHWSDKYINPVADTNSAVQEQTWDDADSSENLRLRGGDAPEVFHEITPTGDTNNERSKVYKQIAQLNKISIEDAVKQVDAEAEAAKLDPNLGLRIKTLRSAGKYDGPITSHEIYQLGKEATMAATEGDVDNFNDRNNVLDATTSFNSTQEQPVETPGKTIADLEKGYFGRGLLDAEITDEMIAAGYFVPGADPTEDTRPEGFWENVQDMAGFEYGDKVANKKYELQKKASEKAKKLGLGLWKDPTQAKIMDAIVDTSYSKDKEIKLMREEGKSHLTGVDIIDESIDTIQGMAGTMFGDAVGLLGKGLKTAGEYNQSEANKKGENYLLWDASESIGDALDAWGTGFSKEANDYFGADGSEGQMVANVTEELMKGNFGNAVDEVTLKDSIKLVAGMAPYVVGMMTGVGQAGIWASIANDGIEEAKMESKDGTISKERTYAILGASALSLGLEKLGIDAVFRGKTPEMISKLIPKNVQSELAKKVAGATGLIAVETLTEPMQELLVVLSTQVGQKEGGLGEELERVLTNPENIKRLAESAVGGTIAGGTVRGTIDGPGIAIETAKASAKGTKKVAETIAKPIAKQIDKSREIRAESKRVEAKEDRISNLEKGEDFAKFDGTTKVEEPDVEKVQVGDSEVEIFKEPTNLKVEAKNTAEYEELLETQKNQVVQSLYEIDPKTSKIKGLSVDAEAMSPEDLKTRVTKVNNWLEKYGNEYVKDTELRKANATVVNSITEDMVIHDKLTDEQRTELVISAVNKESAGIELSKQEAMIMKDGGQVVNDIIAKETAANREAPKAIKDHIEYLTGIDAQVHLEKIREMEAEAEDKAAFEAEITDLEESLEKETDTDKIEDIKEQIETKKKIAEAAKLSKDKESFEETVKEKLVSLAESRPEFDKAPVEDIEKFYVSKLEDSFTSVEEGEIKYAAGWDAERVSRLAKESAGRTHQINSKYRFDKEVGAEVDYDGMLIETRADKIKKGKVVDSTKVNGNKLIDAVIAGTPEIAITNANEKNTKLRHRIFGKISADKAGNKYDIAKALMRKVKAVVDSDKGKKQLKKIFNDDAIADGDGAILVLNTLGAINAAVVTDTLSRQRVKTANVAGQTANLAQKEYWASQTNVLTQIGKDFLSAKGIKLTKGTPTQQAEQYRKIGAIGLELAIEGGLAERSEQSVSSVVSEKAVDSEGKKLDVGGDNVSLVKDAVDVMDDSKKIMLNTSDYGVRVIGSNKAVDSGGYQLDYKNEQGDVAGRINKLLVSSNLELPNDVPSNEVIVSPTVSPFDNGVVDIKDTVIKMQNTAFKIKPAMLKILKKIKSEVDGDKYNGDLDKYLGEQGKYVAQMLGIDRYATESAILAFNDAGVSNGIKDSLRGILDNLEELEEPFYFTYQIDKNNRITIRETVLNFQADKVIARQILMPAKVDSYEMGDAALETQQDMLNELGFKAPAEGTAKEGYDKAIDIILNKSLKDKPKGKLSDGQALVWEIVGILESKTIKNNPVEIANVINDKQSPLYKKSSGKKTIKAMEIIDGFRVMRESGGKRTNYMTETDAKASGVMNVLMNIIGFDTNAKEGELTVEKLLSELGVKLSGGAALKSPKDAYNLLQEKVQEVLSLVGFEDDVANRKFNRERELIAELDELGIDTRELAKPPVMTWFYTAGSQTIINELANTLLEDVFRKAIDGEDAKAKAHINGILGRDSTDELDLKKMKANGVEHKKLMNEYKKIGSLYEAQLEKAFPGVVKFKDTLEGMFKIIEDTGFGNGIIDSSAQAVYGGDAKKTGKFNIHKEKQFMIDLNEENTQGKRQLGKDATERQLVTGNKTFANFTSLIPLLAQGVDFTILEKTMRELYAKYEGNEDFAPMTVHDAIYTSLKYMKETGKGSYNRTIVDVARNYDFVDTIITYGLDTYKRMEKESAKLSKEELIDHKADMERLKNNITKWKKENESRLAHKRAKLKESDKAIKVDLMGGTDLSQEAVKGEVEPAPVVVKSEPVASPMEALQTKAKGMQEPFTETKEADVIKAIEEFQKSEYGVVSKGTLEEYAQVLGAENTVDSVVEKLAGGKDYTVLQSPKENANKVRRNAALSKFRDTVKKNPKEAVEGLINKLVDLKVEGTKGMKGIVANRPIKWVIGTDSEFSISPDKDSNANVITLGKNVKGLKLEEELLEKIGHELEHANSTALIEQLSKGKGTKEDLVAYKTIKEVLKRIDGKEFVHGGRLARVMSEKEEHKRVAELVAVVRGEQEGSAQLVQEIQDTGMLSKVLQKGIDAAKRLIARVRGGKLEVTEDMELEKLIQAVEHIYQSASRIEQDSKVAEEMNYEADAKQQDDKITADEIIKQALECAKG